MLPLLQRAASLVPRRTVAASLRVSGRRCLASGAGDGDADAVTESELAAKLAAAFKPSKLEVIDRSGGCGAMFEVHIVSDAFADMSRVKRQKLVNNVIKDEIARMHGIRIQAHDTDPDADADA